ncbi:hypothetical protein KAJ27_05690 [bacterium]|nr:hypothetical protein [bacterium]
MKKKIWIITTVSFVIIIASIMFFYVNVFIPNRKIMDTEWFKSKPSHKEQRELAHKILSFPFGNHHDALLILIDSGNKESIPYLLSVLKKIENRNKEDGVVCTYAHCVEALKKITGKDFKYEYKDWVKGLKEK